MTNIREQLCEAYGDDLLFMDGPEFDEAILGVAAQGGCCDYVVAYDVRKILKVLERDMSLEDASEYFDFNIGGAYLGEKTPVYIDTVW